MTHLIVHYHLRPGGVTGVVLEEAKYLHDHGLSFAVLSSERGSFEGPQITIPLLDYPCDSMVTGKQLLEMITPLLRSLSQPIVWHIHNPTLGCHPAWTECVALLAEKNERLILHIHDFAEDERPENYRALIDAFHLYPRAARIHYCVLSQRDRNILLRAGLTNEEITILPNPLRANVCPPSAQISPMILYPCRPIDRKNLGELCLWAALADKGVRFATTLLPGKSRNASLHDHWQICINQLDLPIDLGIRSANNTLTLEECVTASTHIISTSVKEGFGMTFLESIAWQRPLFGRVIPHIQVDLASHGIEHPYLYDRIFSVDQPDIDFATQPLDRQTQLIAQARENPHTIMIEQRGKTLPAAQWLAAVLSQRQCPLSRDLLTAFSPEAHGNTIHAIAMKLLAQASSPVNYLDVSSVLAAFSS